MTAQPDSPSWRWQQLGYQVERGPRHSRMILRPDGTAVDIPRTDGRHADEIATAEREYRHLPHGLAECWAAQITLF